jgi:hypothetical protein
VNRRYGRLYDYLQEEAGDLEDLPTVDLCLRLLCRNDRAWQAGRSRLAASDSLAAKGLVDWIGDAGTLLSHQVRLTDDLINYLLATEPPTAVPNFTHGSAPGPVSLSSLPEPEAAALAEALDLPPTPAVETEADVATEESAPTLVAAPHIPSGNWQTLVLPKTLKSQLQGLARQGSERQQADPVMGLMVLVVGPAGTGKTTAATAIATDMEQPLAVLDLATISQSVEVELLETGVADGRPVLVKRGDRWLGRRATADEAQLHQWWQQRQCTSGLTLVTVEHLQAIRPRWRRQFDAILYFSKPDQRTRQKIWAGLWPESLSSPDLDWRWVAKQLPLTGGEMAAIARTACLDLQARRRRTLTLKILRDAVALHHPALATALDCPPRP